MKTYFLSFALVAITLSCVGQSSVPDAELQIKTAVLAAPEELREGAMVYGYDGKGELVVIREGSNEMVCIADDPDREGFSASCYHRDLEPFMQRGRDLKKEGKSTQEIFDMREEEVKGGSLKMPDDPTTLFVLSAPAERYDAATGEVSEPDFRYVVYIPYATAASTGLPLSPEAPGMPWIMDPGTHRAHIMINPPKK
jgi:hypothetical protein